MDLAPTISTQGLTRLFGELAAVAEGAAGGDDGNFEGDGTNGDPQRHFSGA